MWRAALCLSVLLLTAASSDAPAHPYGRHSRVQVGIGFGDPYFYGPRHGYYGSYYGGWYGDPYFGDPFWGYRYGPYFPSRTTVIVREPAPTFPALSNAEPGAPPPVFWYYCEEAGGYYPQIRICPSGWREVADRAQPAAPGGPE